MRLRKKFQPVRYYCVGVKNYTVVVHFYAAHFYAGFDQKSQNLSSRYFPVLCRFYDKILFFSVNLLYSNSRVPFIGSVLGDEDLQILPIIGKFLVELG